MLFLSAVVLVSSRELWLSKKSYLHMRSFLVVLEAGTVWLPGPQLSFPTEDVSH